MGFPPAISDPASQPKPSRTAFTLVEMLVVMGVIALLLSLLVPAVTNIHGGEDFISAANDIGSTLEQARAFAMANNTYVYVGIGEYLVTEPSSTSPRTTGAGAVGQVAVAVVASRDGTRGYDVNSPATTWSTDYQNGGNGVALLTPIDKLHLYNNVHLADFGATPPASGKMARPAIMDAQYRLGNTGSVSATHLSWPLGKTLDAGQYNFTKVIQIDPQGVVRLQTATNADGIASYMEIDLQPTQGSIAPASAPTDQNTGSQAALLLDCMTGAVRVYHP